MSKVSTKKQMTRALITLALEDNYRNPTNGHFRVYFGKTPKTDFDEDVDWDVYRGRFKGWKCVLKYPEVFVKPNWLNRIADAGIAVLDGMLTLDARRLPRRDTQCGETVYKASWVRQGRGLKIEAEHGYIATCGGYAYHSRQNPTHALEGLRNKMEHSQADRDAHSAADLFARASRVSGDVRVSVEDAEAVGSCRPGIEGWCERVGIDINAGSVTLRRFMRGLAIAPRREALATLAHVLRREAGRVQIEERQSQAA